MENAKDESMVTIEEFERKIEEKEGISVIFRVPSKTMVPDYDFQRAAPRNMSVSDFKYLRLNKYVGDCEVVIVDGSHRQPHGRTKMETLRESYYDE
ncbi:MAG: hypothetical protein OXH76_05555 [Boseongicola sp.]|nr:hypothetical protein [Boseongicola sp.]